MNKRVSDYWARYYVSPTGCEHVCSLCGNTGVIDTRKSAKSSAGELVGRLNFCICPNGQTLRRAEKIPSQA